MNGALAGAPASRFQVPADHPALPGHFPGHPVVPGVVLLDLAALHLAALLGVPPGRLWLSSAKFLHPVAPGEIVQLAHQTGAADTLRFTLCVDDREVANGIFVLLPDATPDAGPDTAPTEEPLR